MVAVLGRTYISITFVHTLAVSVLQGSIFAVFAAVGVGYLRVLVYGRNPPRKIGFIVFVGEKLRAATIGLAGVYIPARSGSDKTGIS